MKSSKRRRVSRAREVLWVAWTGLAIGCMGDAGGAGDNPDTTGGGVNGGNATADNGATGSSGGGGMTTGTGGGTSGTTGTCIVGCNTGDAGGGAACTQTNALPTRLVRLDYNKIANTVKAVLGPTVLDAAIANKMLPGKTLDARHRAFNVFLAGETEKFDPSDTSTLTNIMEIVDIGVQALSSSALLSLANSLTNNACGRALTDACAQSFVKALIAETYRRPPLAGSATSSPDEPNNIVALYNTLKALPGATTELATRYAIEGAFLAPQALYRTEFGQDPTANPTPLTPYEMASELSYMLTDGPPDQALLTAAQNNKLSTPDDLTAQIDRILGTAAGRENVSEIIDAYFGLGDIDGAHKDPALFPTFTQGVQDAMYTETDTFVRQMLWGAGTKVNDLILSPTTYINSTLAAFYGVTAPAGATATNFVPFQFPSSQPRQGILTQGSVLTMRSRTDNNNMVIARGTYINANVLCIQNPPLPPTAIQSQVMAQSMDTTQTEIQKAEYRASTSPCNGCHPHFDPYGFVLENYDAVGLYRTEYPDGSAIDAATTLPPDIGGGKVSNAIDLANDVASTGLFSKCIASNLLKYAYAQAAPSVTAQDCAVQQIQDAFNASDQSMTSLVRAVALSPALSLRAGGQ